MEFNNSYKRLAKIIEPEVFGEVIGTGFNSVAINPDNKWQIELNFNSVLIVSLEKEKELFLKKILKIKKVNYKKIKNKEIKYYVCMVEESFSVFYMEKLREIDWWEDFSEENIENINGFFRSINGRFSEIYHKDDLFWIIEELKTIQKKHKGVNVFYRALKKSLNAIKKSTIDSLFTIDVHEGQFMFNNKNKIVCIDPVLFNYKELRNLN